MVVAQKLYPRATVKKIVKAHSKRNVSKNVDILVGTPPQFDASPDSGTNSLCRYFSTMRSSYKRMRPNVMMWRPRDIGELCLI